MSLKELMREKQAARSGNVSHPAAVYNSVGKLTCKICQMIVGSDALWPAHIRSSVHVQVWFFTDRYIPASRLYFCLM